MPRVVVGGRPCPGKILVQRSTPCGNSRAVHISPHNSGTLIDSEKSSIKANRKSAMYFTTRHQLRSYVTINVPKMGFRYPDLSFFAEISIKNHKKSSTEFHCLKTSSSRIIARSTTYRMVSTFWQGMAPFTQNLSLNAPTSNRKDARFMFHTQSAL